MLAVSLATEGDLDEQVLRRILRHSAREIEAGVCYGKHGRDQLKQNILRFNQAAPVRPFIILADLEDAVCAPRLIQEWLPHGAHANLVLRIAVRMVESWLLADRETFAKFLGVPPSRLPTQPDLVDHPKNTVIQIARRSRYKSIRDDLTPLAGSTRRVGPNYVGQMTRFVLEQWQVKRAAEHSPSLAHALRAIENFSPVLPH